MVRLGTDVIRAAALAVLAASLVGVATYMLTPQIEMEGPRPRAMLDAYTGKGGSGPNVVSSSYLANENLTMFASLKDESDNPMVDTTVTFELHGPPNPYSNITVQVTVETDSSGVAVANVTIPYGDAPSETVVGIWSAVARTEISGDQIDDSVAFEVKQPPTPFVDVYTDRGGRGSNMPGQQYDLDETVRIYAEVSDGTDPVVNGDVTFAVYAPSPADEGQSITFLVVNSTDEFGIAESSLKPPPVAEISTGIWRVIVTVRVGDQVFMDALTFEVK